MNSLPKLLGSIASSHLIALFLFAAVIAGCATDPRYAVAVYYVDVVPPGTAKNRTTAGVPVYYGVPQRPYEILGGTLAPVGRGQLAEYVALRAKNAGGDAVIVLRPSPEYDGMALIQVIRFKH
jgi:hypothetical protein